MKLNIGSGLRKVPEVTAYFWAIKLLSTALGESTSDYMVHTISPMVAVLIGAIGFSIAIILQFWVKKYEAFIYWFAVVMVAIFGTMAADVVHIVLGVPYLLSTLGFSIILFIIFSVWYKLEKTLSIHTVNNFRREFFYWSTVVATFALGTALGDMTAVTLNLGYLTSGILFGILFVIPGIAYFKFGLSEVASFWFAYIMTRPLGASFADWFGRTTDMGGVGFGTGRTSMILAVLIIIFVAYLSLTKKDIKKSKAV